MNKSPATKRSDFFKQQCPDLAKRKMLLPKGEAGVGVANGDFFYLKEHSWIMLLMVVNKTIRRVK